MNEKIAGENIVLMIDFYSEEAIYIQLRNQIILGIATEEIRNGDSLPSVRELANHIGINMHTVNKAYSVLKQEGFVKVDRRKGAIICIDIDKYEALQELRQEIGVLLAKAHCKHISRDEIHQIIDEIFDVYFTPNQDHS